MLTGVLIGIIAAFVWSITNIIDKYLIDKYAFSGNVGGILLLSCFFPLVLLFLALLIAGSTIIAINSVEILILVISGFLMVAWLYFYLKALSFDDSSVVMTLLVLAPIFSLIFGAIILKELPTLIQLLAVIVMISGALSVVYEPKLKRFKWKVFWYAIAASAITGLMHSLFKFVAVDSGVWESLFWRSLGMVAIGLAIYLFIKSYRREFHLFIRSHFSKGVGLNTTNETLTLVGDTIFAVAILFAPLVLVQTTEAYQPIFIFLIILIINYFGFKVITENIERRILIQKGTGFILVLAGTLLLSI